MDYTEAISRINPEDLVFVEVFGQKPSVRRELWGGEFWTDIMELQLERRGIGRQMKYGFFDTLVPNAKNPKRPFCFTDRNPV